jgi:1-acyl-sn-glycerol-3-phosphate acyltransferase
MAVSPEAAGDRATDGGPQTPPEPTTSTTEVARRAVSFSVDPRRTPLYRIFRRTFVGILKVWFRPRVRGRGNVPVSGAAIIAPVHRSNVDFGFTPFLTKRKLFFMAKEELWKVEWFGRVLSSFGVFPVHRSGTDRESVRRAEDVLRQGHLLVMFPEGSRRSGDEIGELMEGVAFLAARTGAPIVPVGIFGSDQAMPKGSVFPKPRAITVSVGEPIEIPGREAGRRVARSQVHQLTDTLRERLQAAYDDAAR